MEVNGCHHVFNVIKWGHVRTHNSNDSTRSFGRPFEKLCFVFHVHFEGNREIQTFARESWSLLQSKSHQLKKAWKTIPSLISTSRSLRRQSAASYRPPTRPHPAPGCSDSVSRRQEQIGRAHTVQKVQVAIEDHAAMRNDSIFTHTQTWPHLCPYG